MSSYWFGPGQDECYCPRPDNSCSGCIAGTIPSSFYGTTGNYPSVKHRDGMGYSGDGLYHEGTYSTLALAEAASCDSTSPISSRTDLVTRNDCLATIVIIQRGINADTGGSPGWNPRKLIHFNGLEYSVYCDSEYEYSILSNISLGGGKVQLDCDITVSRRPSDVVRIRAGADSQTLFSRRIEFPGLNDCSATISVALGDMTETSAGCVDVGDPACPFPWPSELDAVQITFDPT